MVRQSGLTILSLFAGFKNALEKRGGVGHGYLLNDLHASFNVM